MLGKLHLICMKIKYHARYNHLYNAAFHKGLQCLLRFKQRTEIRHNLELLKVHNGQSHTYCINMFRT